MVAPLVLRRGSRAANDCAVARLQRVNASFRPKTCSLQGRNKFDHTFVGPDCLATYPRRLLTGVARHAYGIKFQHVPYALDERAYAARLCEVFATIREPAIVVGSSMGGGVSRAWPRCQPVYVK